MNPPEFEVYARGTALRAAADLCASGRLPSADVTVKAAEYAEWVLDTQPPQPVTAAPGTIPDTVMHRLSILVEDVERRDAAADYRVRQNLSALVAAVDAWNATVRGG